MTVLSKIIKSRTFLVVGAIAFLLVTAFCLRGWLRNSGLPALVEVTFGKRLTKITEQQTAPIHTKLAPLGFTFQEWPGYAPDKICGLAYFHNFKETVVCEASYAAKFTPTTEQQEALTQQGDDIERWLFDNGWVKQQAYDGRPLSQFSNAEYASSVYKKMEGSVECLVSISWQKQQTLAFPKATLSAFTSCGGKVKFFGGSDTLFDEAII